MKDSLDISTETIIDKDHGLGEIGAGTSNIDPTDPGTDPFGPRTIGT